MRIYSGHWWCLIAFDGLTPLQFLQRLLIVELPSEKTLL